MTFGKTSKKEGQTKRIKRKYEFSLRKLFLCKLNKIKKRKKSHCSL